MRNITLRNFQFKIEKFMIGRDKNRNLSLVDNKIFLKKLSPEKDITIKYKSWLNDKKLLNIQNKSTKNILLKI